jgi:hypothetical protein
MRDLVFKNLTSQDRRRKVISSSEISDIRGMRTIVRRHFLYTIKEVKNNQVEKPCPYVYILKQRNTLEAREKFFFKLKGSVLAVYKNKLFLVLFMHSLRIDLAAVSDNIVQD